MALSDILSSIGNAFRSQPNTVAWDDGTSSTYQTPSYMSQLASSIGSGNNKYFNLAQQLANDYTDAQKTQDLYNVMDARQATPLAQDLRAERVNSNERERISKQRSALQKLAQGQSTSIRNSPLEYLQDVAAITGDPAPVMDYMQAQARQQNSRPATLQVADEYLKALEGGDMRKANALEAIGKFFDKGVLSGGGEALLGSAPPSQQPAQPTVQQPQSGALLPPPDMTTNPNDQMNDMGRSIISGGSVAQLPISQQAIPSSGGFGVPQSYADAITRFEAQKAAAKSGADEQAKLQQQLQLNPQIQTAEAQAKYMESGRQALPKQQRALQSAESRNQNINRVITNVKSNADKAFTTGFSGSLASQVAGTPAYDLNQNLQTLRANAAFDTLQTMRENSPTGGALGAVSDTELGLLQAAYTNLENSQSKEQFLENLAAFEKQNNSSLQRMKEAYQQDYQRFGGSRDSMLPAPALSSTTPIPSNSASGATPKRLKFNPATGMLE